MTNYEERYKEINDLGFYFNDDQKFKDFLNDIEKLKGNEKNYYYALRAKLIWLRNSKYKRGVPLDPTKKDGKRESSIPIVGGHIKVIFKEEESKRKGSTRLKRYEIIDIKINDNSTLNKWADKRYLTKN